MRCRWPRRQASYAIFPAVLETRRFGPVEEPAPQFYSMRNSHEPGFDWGAAQANSWGAGWGWGSGWGWGWGLRSLPYAIGPVGYNRYFNRPWYSYPNNSVWSDRFPWYSPGGAGPNIYQPWYLQRNSLPWYSPYGIGPNIYTPSYQWNSYYPWYCAKRAGAEYLHARLSIRRLFVLVAKRLTRCR